MKEKQKEQKLNFLKELDLQIEFKNKQNENFKNNLRFDKRKVEEIAQIEEQDYHNKNNQNLIKNINYRKDLETQIIDRARKNLSKDLSILQKSIE